MGRASSEKDLGCRSWLLGVTKLLGLVRHRDKEGVLRARLEIVAAFGVEKVRLAKSAFAVIVWQTSRNFGGDVADRQGWLVT